MPNCQGCGTPIMFLKSAGGWMPVEAVLRKVVLHQDVAVQPIKDSPPPPQYFGYLEHWTRCPQKQMFTKPEGLP